MINHPSFKKLNDYADRELSEARRARVAKHLAKCPACRITVSSIRKLTTEAPQILVMTPPDGALERILERQAAGERVILPIADPTREGLAAGRILRPAGTALLVVAAVMMAFSLGVGELGAERSELGLTAADANGWNLVEAEYRSTSMLAGEDHLTVRVRYRIPGDQLYTTAPREMIGGHLIRDGRGRFRGAVQLPDSAVYAVFAVEDESGRRVDSNGGGLWDRMRETAGKPDFAALVQRQHDLSGRNWELALETARRATELYPRNPEAWGRLSAIERLGAGSRGLDSLRSAHAARFTELEETLSTQPLSGDYLAWMYQYALSTSQDSATIDYWERRLLGEAPRQPVAVQLRVFDILQAEHPGPNAVLEELERLWVEVGSTHASLSRAGYSAALRTGAADAIMRWADRHASAQPSVALAMAEQLCRIPALRHLGMTRLREHLKRLDAQSSDNRALQRSTREHAIYRETQRQRVLVALGKALVAAGQSRAGLDTLALVVGDGWNVDAFQAVADARLALGDTAAAVVALANVAVDPGTEASGAEIQEVLGTDVLGRAGWEVLLEGARTKMFQRTLAAATNRTLLTGAELVGPDGKTHRLQDLTTGRVTLVAFWARYCVPCLEELPRLQVIAGRITQSDGVDAFIITGEPPSVELEQFVADEQLTLPVFHDTDRAAHRAFESWETPGYFIVDAAGRVRFHGTSLDDVVRQVGALRSTGSE